MNDDDNLYRYQPLSEGRYRVWYIDDLGEADTLEDAMRLADEHKATYERGD